MSDYADFIELAMKELAILNQSQASLAEAQARTAQKVDDIFRVVVGDGGPTSMAGRLMTLEHSQAQAKIDRDHLAQDVEEIRKEVHQTRAWLESWRNRAIGIGLALSGGGGVVGFLGSRILDLVK